MQTTGYEGVRYTNPQQVYGLPELKQGRAGREQEGVEVMAGKFQIIDVPSTSFLFVESIKLINADSKLTC